MNSIERKKLFNSTLKGACAIILAEDLPDERVSTFFEALGISNLDDEEIGRLRKVSAIFKELTNRVLENNTPNGLAYLHIQVDTINPRKDE